MALIVFDLDGTLVDSRVDLANSVNATLQEFGAAPLPLADVTSMVGEGARVLIERALGAARLPIQDAPRALSRFLEIYDQHLLDHTRAYDGIDGVLRQLRSVAHLAILTNKPGRASRRVVEGLGFGDVLAEVIGGDSPFPRKPAPAALLHLMRAHGASRENSLMVGDSSIDVNTARAAGIRCCLVRYGFGFPKGATHGPDVLIAETPGQVGELCLSILRTGQEPPRWRR